MLCRIIIHIQHGTEHAAVRGFVRHLSSILPPLVGVGCVCVCVCVCTDVADEALGITDCATADATGTNKNYIFNFFLKEYFKHELIYL